MALQIGSMKKNLHLSEPMSGTPMVKKSLFYALMKPLFQNFQWMSMGKPFTKHNRFLNTLKPVNKMRLYRFTYMI